MDLMSLEKLLEQAKIAEKIAEGIVDDQAYNVITQTVNESVLVEAEGEIEHILHNGRTINDRFNLDDLEVSVNKALGIVEAVSVTPKVGVAPKPVSQTDVEKKALEAKKQATKVADKMVDGGQKLPPQKIDKGMMNVAKPSLVVADAKSFKAAPAVAQKDFVNANIELGKKKFDQTAKSDMSEMQKDANANKKFDDKGQNVPKAKFEGYVTSLKTSENELLIESVLEAFRLLHN